jgi:hypothetical protein
MQIPRGFDVSISRRYAEDSDTREDRGGRGDAVRKGSDR